MSARYRAMRFGFPVTNTGAVSTVSGDDAIRQAIILLLGTRPGERLMRPRYGSYLHRLLFAPNDNTTAGLAIHYVRQAIGRWEPRIEILSLDAGPDPLVPTRLDIRLRYRVRASLTVNVLDYPFDLGPLPTGGAS
jgi:phage baseplate assembly protein W